MTHYIPYSRWIALAAILACMIPTTLVAQHQQVIDFGDIVMGPAGAVKPIAQFQNTGTTTLTYSGSVEGSTQFGFDPPSVGVPPGAMIIWFVIFHPKREGPDSALGHITMNGMSSSTAILRGRGVRATAGVESGIAGGVRLRQADDGAASIIDVTQERSGRVKITLWSLDGRLLAEPVDELANGGLQSYRIDMGSFATGSVLCRVEASGGAWSAVVRR